MASKLQSKSKITRSGRKLMFRGGSPDAVKREPPKGKGRKRTMKMK